MRKYVFIIITLILIVSACTVSFGNTEQKKNIYYEVVEISKGDCLWTLAATFKGENENTKEYVNKIKKLNNMDSDLIKAGQKIILPVYY
ncbi:MAG: cell division suppressor protein YneA [Anaerotignaceae bacterium]